METESDRYCTNTHVRKYSKFYKNTLGIDHYFLLDRVSTTLSQPLHSYRIEDVLFYLLSGLTNCFKTEFLADFILITTFTPL